MGARTSLHKFPEGYQLLPSPGQWRPAVRMSRVVPFGYKVDPCDDKLLLPIPEELELLQKAKLFLREYSARDVAQWLTEKSGRSISHEGLRKRVKQDKLTLAKRAAHEYYAGLFQEAAKKAKDLDRIAREEASGYYQLEFDFGEKEEDCTGNG